VTTSSAVSINLVRQTGLITTADAYVRDGSSASTNFGSATDLQAQVSATSGHNRETYLKYDLTSVANITKATIRLFSRLSDSTATNVPAAIYSVATTTWTETGIAWNNKPAAGSSALATTTITDNVARWYEWDVTAYVQAEKAAGRNTVCFVVKGTGNSSNFMTFNSKEATGNRPQLVLWTTSARTALLVVGSTTLNSGDNAVKTRLQNLGYTVTAVASNTSLNASSANGMSLVAISSTVTPANVTNKFTNLAIPVLNWRADLMDDLGMTGTPTTEYGTTATQTQVSIINAAHALAAGLSGTITVVSASNTFTWGKPNANAAKIATLTSDATKIMIFGYDNGATMPGLDAPARRVGFFLHNTTAASLNTNGGNLFDVAVKWLADAQTSPTITSLSPSLGLAGAAVTINGFNFGSTQGASTVSFNGRPTTITSWADKKLVATVPVNATTGPVVVTVNAVASNGLIFAVGETDSDGDGLPDNNPSSGRWLSKDPIQESGGANLYAFVINAPQRYIDAHGLRPEERPPTTNIIEDAEAYAALLAARVAADLMQRRITWWLITAYLNKEGQFTLYEDSIKKIESNKIFKTTKEDIIAGIIEGHGASVIKHEDKGFPRRVRFGPDQGDLFSAFYDFHFGVDLDGCITGKQGQYRYKGKLVTRYNDWWGFSNYDSSGFYIGGRKSFDAVLGNEASLLHQGSPRCKSTVLWLYNNVAGLNLSISTAL
jgi:hypothetical protein